MECSIGEEALRHGSRSKSRELWTSVAELALSIPQPTWLKELEHKYRGLTTMVEGREWWKLIRWCGSFELLDLLSSSRG